MARSRPVSRTAGIEDISQPSLVQDVPVIGKRSQVNVWVVCSDTAVNTAQMQELI